MRVCSSLNCLSPEEVKGNALWQNALINKAKCRSLKAWSDCDQSTSRWKTVLHRFAGKCCCIALKRPREGSGSDASEAGWLAWGLFLRETDAGGWYQRGEAAKWLVSHGRSPWYKMCSSSAVSLPYAPRQVTCFSRADYLCFDCHHAEWKDTENGKSG